jgi:hypothetical protein
MCHRLKLSQRVMLATAGCLVLAYEGDRPAFDTGLRIAGAVLIVVLAAAGIILGVAIRRMHSPARQVQHLTRHRDHAPPRWPDRPAYRMRGPDR